MIYPYFLLVFGLYFELDPLMMAYKYWIPFHFKWNFTLRICLNCGRLLQLISFLLGCHLFCKLAIIPTILVHGILGCIECIDARVADISNWKKGTENLQRHKSLEIILTLGDGAIRVGALGILAFLSVLAVMFNFVSLKLYGIIPMPMYLYFPSVAVAIPCALSFMLPMAINVYENDKKVHDKWKYYCYQSTKVKFLKRQVDATKVIRIYAGIGNFTFFEVKKAVKPRYFYETMYYTITALLSIAVNGNY